MKLKSVIFYQGVKLWDGNLYGTVQEGTNKGNQNVTITLKDHLVTLETPDSEEIVIVGTANMREARGFRLSVGNESVLDADSSKVSTSSQDIHTVEEDITTEDKSALEEFAGKLSRKAKAMPVTAVKDAKTQKETPIKKGKKA